MSSESAEDEPLVTEIAVQPVRKVGLRQSVLLPNSARR
jgi:hypothetical protein